MVAWTERDFTGFTGPWVLRNRGGRGQDFPGVVAVYRFFGE